jgi:hypothetical protein
MEEVGAHLNCYSIIYLEIIMKYELMSWTGSKYEICRIRKRSASYYKVRFDDKQMKI